MEKGSKFEGFWGRTIIENGFQKRSFAKYMSLTLIFM